MGFENFIFLRSNDFEKGSFPTLLIESRDLTTYPG
jgi:hypothetical protein